VIDLRTIEAIEANRELTQTACRLIPPASSVRCRLGHFEPRSQPEARQNVLETRLCNDANA